MRDILEDSLSLTSTRIAMSPPVGGWNARNPLASMRKDDAIILDNIYPRLTDVIVRPGFRSWASVPTSDPLDEVTHNIKSLIPYQPVSGLGKLFAANDDGIYNVTEVGEKTAEAVAISTNGYWQSVNMTTAGGNFLWMCNGEDDCIMYDNTDWTILNALSTPALTGVTSAKVSNVSIWKNRIILLENHSMSFWYLPLNSIAGAAEEFPLGALFNLGGYLVATCSWTLDAGEGADDYFVAITSQGELAVYKGTDPSMAGTFALVGIYVIGKPLGKRCFIKVGGDVYILTVGGMLPLSKALIAASVNRSIAISDKIVEAWNTYAIQYGGLLGWQAVLFPEANMLMVNVPFRYDHILKKTWSYQFAMNTITGSWARFTGQDADCWAEFNGKLFFASENKVFRAWDGAQDGDIGISVKCKMAYNQLIRGSLKRIAMIRFILKADSTFNIQVGIDSDYEETELSSSTSPVEIINDKWDTAKWDEAKWAGSVLRNSWKTVFHKPGNTLSIRLQFYAKNVTVQWSAMDLIIERMKSLF